MRSVSLASWRSQLSFLIRDIKNIHTSVNPVTHGILDSLCSWDPHPKSRLANFLSRRSSKNAGNWLIQYEELTAWKSNPGRVLWLYGDGGVGKTILLSIILKHLFKNYSTSDIGIAFLYFDYKSAGSAQTLRSAISSLARQYIVQKGKPPKSLERQFRSGQGSLPPDSLDEAQLYELLVKVSGSFRTMYLVVDALDELKDPEMTTNRRLSFLHELQKLRSSSGCSISVLVTSRPDLYDIQEYFASD